MEGPPLEQWDATGAVDLWFNSKARRLNQNPRDKQKQNAPSVEEDEEDSEKFVFSLQDWEAWMSQ